MKSIPIVPVRDGFKIFTTSAPYAQGQVPGIGSVDTNVYYTNPGELTFSEDNGEVWLGRFMGYMNGWTVVMREL